MPSRPEILLVEDNPADAELILLTLGEANLPATIRVAHDGAEALTYLEGAADGLPRLVLLDLKLPKVDGLEVLRRLKADPKTQALPVVMLTSSAVERDVVAAYRLGANSYIQKPVDFEQFRRVLVDASRYWLEVSVPPPAGAFGGKPA